MKRILVVFVVFAIMLPACGATATPTPTVVLPTSTPTSTTTPTTAPSPTPHPTNTPWPTSTTQPTNTPTAKDAIPPRARYVHGYEVTEIYDKFKDETNVTLNPRLSDIRNGPNNLIIVYTYKGTMPAVPPLVSFGLMQMSDTWKYLKCHDLVLLLDDRIRIQPTTEQEGEVGNGYVLEIVYATLSSDQFLQIVNAKKVEGQLCNTQFALSGLQMDALRDAASRMQP